MKWAHIVVLTGRKETSKGYTIVESMIFLAVSAVIAVTAMMMISGQQRKTEFQQSVREFESMIQDASNDVATGFSSTNNDICWYSAGNIMQDSGSPAGQPRCIFVGKALEMTNTGDYRIKTLVGRQRTPSGSEVKTLTEANVAVYTRANVSRTLAGGATFGKIKCANCAAPSTVGAFTFLTNFSGANLLAGSDKTNIAPVTPSSLTSTPSYTPATLATVNPAQGLEICLLSGGTRQYALITIGGVNGQLRTQNAIYEGTVCP